MYRQKAFHTKREDTQMSLIRHHSPPPSVTPQAAENGF